MESKDLIVKIFFSKTNFSSKELGKKLDKYLKYIDNSIDNNNKSINEVHLSKLFGNVLAIDIYIYIYHGNVAL